MEYSKKTSNCKLLLLDGYYTSVKRSIQESPWNLTFASVNGYDFLNNMQMKKTQTFPPTKRAIPIVGWYRFFGEFTHPAREIDFLYYGSKEVEYVLVDIPEERVMLSDAFAWTSIMLGEYYAGYKSREDQRKKLEHFKNLYHLLSCAQALHCDNPEKVARE